MKAKRAALALMLLTAISSGLVAAANTPEPGERQDAGRMQSPPSERTPPRARVSPMSDRCETMYVNCILFDRQPRGSSCWCVTPFGPSYGKVR